MEQKESIPKVYSSISKVMNEVVVGKNGKNTYDKYSYRSIDDVYNVLNPAMVKAGLVMIPSVLEAFEEEGTSAKGNKQVRTRLKVEYKIICTEDGSQTSSVVYGEAIDRSDKSYNKAFTAAFKYAVLQIFCIPLENAPDADSDSPEIPEEKKPKAQAKAKKKSKVTNKSKVAAKTYIIPEGTHKGKDAFKMNREELEDYYTKSCEYLKASGQAQPDWFAKIGKVLEAA